ncbi:hypothetical protein [Aquimarina sp. 2201CG5-10]|uniref:hypothetical protein n=1 Tax=Aquimarina callyspongiae TaxID=3098150 RepID=UPI002AB5381F|nr:hypothetical protein [Aquimarina sp. 2201CG5-10]MDY8137985.1 hypothetical protein [Aquimarina sp. 2201CG5-10]
MKSFFNVIFLGIMIFSLQGCTTAIIDESTGEMLPPITRTITYESDVRSIMNNYCITCHGGPAPNADLDLSTYLNTKNATQARNLIQRMNNATNPMPPNGLLTPQIRQLMDKWIADGLLEQQ